MRSERQSNGGGLRRWERVSRRGRVSGVGGPIQVQHGSVKTEGGSGGTEMRKEGKGAVVEWNRKPKNSAWGEVHVYLLVGAGGRSKAEGGRGNVSCVVL
jgi:hypothetical protein